MGIQVIKFYEVSDCFSADGRGATTVIGRFTSNAVANDYAFGRGNYGRDANVTYREINLYESIEDIERKEEESLVNSALSKLSDKEKKALGLS